MQNWPRYVCLAALVALVCSQSYAQRQLTGLSGIVYDSATRESMPYVSVVNLATHAGTMSANNGTFTIGSAPGDSIVFTMVGYSPKKLVVNPGTLSLIVFLSESTRTLDQVTVYGSYKPQGSDQWKTVMEVPPVFINPAAPGSGYNVQTFGAGISITGLMARMGRSEKEKRKVAAIREKSRKSEVYTEMIMSGETKSFFRKTFSMSEAEYNTFLARFNRAYPEAAYLDDKEEIRNLMVVFKATNK